MWTSTPSLTFTGPLEPWEFQRKSKLLLLSTSKEDTPRGSAETRNVKGSLREGGFHLVPGELQPRSRAGEWSWESSGACRKPSAAPTTYLALMGKRCLGARARRAFSWKCFTGICPPKTTPPPSTPPAFPGFPGRWWGREGKQSQQTCEFFLSLGKEYEWLMLTLGIYPLSPTKPNKKVISRASMILIHTDLCSAQINHVFHYLLS